MKDNIKNDVCARAALQDLAEGLQRYNTAQLRIYHVKNNLIIITTDNKGEKKKPTQNNV